MRPGDAVTYADILAALQRDPPETRLSTVLKLRCRIGNAEWWPLLGLVWYSCTDIAGARKKLTAELKQATPEDLRMMMSAPSAAAWDALPPEFTVYRGCDEGNRPGLSWTTCREVATAYALSPRLLRPGRVPLLLTGSVNKRFCVLMVDRGEAEVVAWVAWRVGQEAL